jgi:hypothetical protein
MIYCICSPYCCYTCDLKILGTCIEASILFVQNWGMTVTVLVVCVEGEEPLSLDLKGLESGAPEPSCFGHVVFMVTSCRVGPRRFRPTPGTWKAPGPHMIRSAPKSSSF